MRKYLIVAICLFALDQIIKLIIAYFFVDIDISIIPNVLSLSPFKNIYLGAVAIIFDINLPISYSAYFSVVFVITAFVIYRYFSFISRKNRIFTNGFLIFAVAAGCSVFIDAIVWNGCWDYICLFDTLIIDLKDLYIVISLLFLYIYSITYIPQYLRLSKKEKQEMDFGKWLRKGCPLDYNVNTTI